MAFIFVFGTDFWEQNLTTTKKHLTKYKTEKRVADNSTLAIGGVPSSLDSFVVSDSSVLRTNFCAEKPALCQSAKGY